MNTGDYLKEQIIAISKAGAYDVLRPQLDELQAENKVLKSENEQLKIRLKGALEMLEAFKDAWNKVKPEDAKVFELSPIFNQDDLKDINI